MKTDPSAEVVETLASSIGARSQSARTYLERNLDQFPAGLCLTSTNEFVVDYPFRL